MKICLKGLHSYIGKQCKECYKSWQLLNKEQLSTKKSAYDKANREKQNARRRLIRAANPEKYKALDKVSRQKRQYKRTALQVKRQAAKLQRTPEWLTKTHLTQIEIFYQVANTMTKETNIQFDVDHIIPLQGKLVSGLHVPWNLQVIPHYNNMSKGNR